MSTSAILDLLGTHDALTARVAVDLTEGIRATGLDVTTHLAIPFGDDRLALQLITSEPERLFQVTARDLGGVPVLRIHETSAPWSIDNLRIEAEGSSAPALHDAVVEALEAISEALGEER